MKKVAVVGAGSWGTALAVMLSKYGHEVCMWARNESAVKSMQETRTNKQYLPGVVFPAALHITNDIEECLGGAELVISAVPSKAVRETAQKFSHLFAPGLAIVNVAKGLEAGSLMRLSEVIKECIPQCEVCALSGPSHAEEVGRDIPTACVIACEKEEVAKMVQKEFMNPHFRVYTNTDVIGVEIGAALKNIMALAAGMSDGLGFGDNTKAALMTRGMAEMQRLGTAMGGQSETFTGLSGIGDLIVTCTSMHSRNRRAGILLGEGRTLEETLQAVQMVVEGVNTVVAACDMAQKLHVSMPITEEINQVLFHGKDVRTAVVHLMTRDGKAE